MYARKAHAGRDPNDRRYDREIEKAMQRLRSDELSELQANDRYRTDSDRGPKALTARDPPRELQHSDATAGESGIYPQGVGRRPRGAVGDCGVL